jgi:hypothetical protein
LAESVSRPAVVAYVTRPLVRLDKLKLAPAIVPVSVGLADKTLLPVPVLVTDTTFLLASKANAVDAVKPDSVVVDDVESVVNAPVLGVVAPTVPLNALVVSVAPVIVGLVKVLFVRVSVVALPTKVSVAAGKVRVKEDAVFGPATATCPPKVA